MLLKDDLIYSHQHLEGVIKSRIPGIQSLISKTVADLEAELSHLGKPISTDAGVSLVCVCVKMHLIDVDVYIWLKILQGKLLLIMDICRAFDQIYKEHLNGM